MYLRFRDEIFRWRKVLVPDFLFAYTAYYGSGPGSKLGPITKSEIPENRPFKGCTIIGHILVLGFINSWFKAKNNLQLKWTKIWNNSLSLSLLKVWLIAPTATAHFTRNGSSTKRQFTSGPLKCLCLNLLCCCICKCFCERRRYTTRVSHNIISRINKDPCECVESEYANIYYI